MYIKKKRNRRVIMEQNILILRQGNRLGHRTKNEETWKPGVIESKTASILIALAQIPKIT